MRINNIECRKYVGRKDLFEIVKWQPSDYFGRESEFNESFGGEFYIPKNGTSTYIDKSLFKNPESCFVVVFLEKTEDGFNLRSVGDRILELNKQELKDFMEVYKKKVKFKNERN